MKTFTVHEANRELPRLARLLPELRACYRSLHARKQDASELVSGSNIVNEGPVDPAYFKALLGMRTVLKQIEEMGVQIKDIDTGLVDFPARLYGRDVLLCWRLGEEKVAFWHDLEAGFAGRQPLPEDGPRDPGEGESVE